MSIGKHVLLIITATILVLVSLSDAVPGTASFYNEPYVPSACFGFKDQGIFVAGASDAIWDNGAACGKIYNASCTGPKNPNVPQPCIPGRNVIFIIVDQCANCPNTINLSKDTFAFISDLEVGEININYERV